MKSLLPFLFLVACESPPVPSEDDARKEIEAAEPSRRLMLIEAHVAEHPDSANAHLWLARAYRERDDARSDAEFDKAIELAPTDPIPRIEKAYMSLEPSLRRGVNPEPAAIDAAKALVAPVAGNGATCETRHQMVGLYEIELGAGRIDDAAGPWLEAAIAACPTEAPKWRATLGRWYAAKDDLPHARDASCGAVKDGNEVAAADCQSACSRLGKGVCAPTTVGEWIAVGLTSPKDEACAAFAQGVAIDASGAAKKAADAHGCPP